MKSQDVVQRIQRLKDKHAELAAARAKLEGQLEAIQEEMEREGVTPDTIEQVAQEHEDKAKALEAEIAERLDQLELDLGID